MTRSADLPETLIDDYFLRVAQQYGNQSWVNNPTPEEADLAIRHGAVSCTTNPTYAARMLRAEPELTRTLIRECLSDADDSADAADMVQRRLAGRIAERFRPIFDETEGRNGWVSIQGDPYRDDDAEHIVQEARAYRDVAPNIIPKIPATEAGLEAMDVLVVEGHPVLATEIFAIAQALDTAERLQAAREPLSEPPYVCVTHITGIFDEYLQQVVERDGIDIAPDVLRQAGCAVARKEWRLLSDLDLDMDLLGGGVRGTHHFTDLVGGDFHVTMNWSTMEEILQQPPELEPRLEDQVPAEVIEELRQKLPDFRRAWDDGGISLAKYADYGPVRHFRDKFIDGWNALVQIVREEKRR